MVVIRWVQWQTCRREGRQRDRNRVVLDTGRLMCSFNQKTGQKSLLAPADKGVRVNLPVALAQNERLIKKCRPVVRRVHLRYLSRFDLRHRLQLNSLGDVKGRSRWQLRYSNKTRRHVARVGRVSTYRATVNGSLINGQWVTYMLAYLHLYVSKSPHMNL